MVRRIYELIEIQPERELVSEKMIEHQKRIKITLERRELETYFQPRDIVLK